MQRLRLHNTGGHIHLRSENFKKWLWEAYPDEGLSSLQAGTVAEFGGDHSLHVAEKVDTELNRADDPSPDPKREHGHPCRWPIGIAVEFSLGKHRYLHEGKCTPPRCPTWVFHREGDRGSNLGAVSGAGFS